MKRKVLDLELSSSCMRQGVVSCNLAFTAQPFHYVLSSLIPPSLSSFCRLSWDHSFIPSTPLLIWQHDWYCASDTLFLVILGMPPSPGCSSGSTSYLALCLSFSWCDVSSGGHWTSLVLHWMEKSFILVPCLVFSDEQMDAPTFLVSMSNFSLLSLFRVVAISLVDSTCFIYLVDGTGRGILYQRMVL